MPATLSFVAGIEPSYAAASPARTSATVRHCSRIGTTSPHTIPRCSAHSPTAWTSGSDVRNASSTTIPRPTSAPAAAASDVSDRIPIDTTTRSASSVSPPANSRPDGVIVRVARSSWTSTSSASSSIAADPASSWRSISRSMRCTTVTGQPWDAIPRAASRPSSPPPITAACVASAAAARMRSQSSGPRNACTCGRSMPGIGGISALDPVARTSLPYGSAVPSSSATTLSATPIASTRRPSSGRTWWSSNHSRGRSWSVSADAPDTRISLRRTRS